jgi:hypothetical protein
LPVDMKRLKPQKIFQMAMAFFRLPKYTGRHHYMGVFKSGYVCWDSLHIFHPLGNSYEERIEKRKGHDVKNGIVNCVRTFQS